MSLNGINSKINPQGFGQTRLPMNLSERSMLASTGLANTGANNASRAAFSVPSSPTQRPPQPQGTAQQVQAPTAKPAPRFRTLQPSSPAVSKQEVSAPLRNPYQAKMARANNDEFVITADTTFAGDPDLTAPSSSVGSTSSMVSPLAEKIKDIQSMASKLGYVELSEGAITKAIQNRSSLLANYVV